MENSPQTLDVYSYITSEEASYATLRVPITGSKDWNMKEHIERCTNVANGWFHKGENDGSRPYNDIVTPIINVAFRSEGFDVKDIVPFVNNPDDYHKSFLVKKYHPQWARENDVDTFIDDLVETSVIYDLALIKNVNKPEVVPLQSIAFCDQTDVLSGPICLKHQYSVADLLDFKGKWYNDKIDEAITMAQASKPVANANGQEVKTPGKYIEVYELHGSFPDHWLNEGGGDNYTPQLHIVTYYTDSTGKKNGICLFKGPEKKSIFKALKIDRIKSYGRACGRSIVETLFEPQVWTNYSAIRIKELLDAAALVLFQTASEEYANQKLSQLKANTVMKHEPGNPITKMDTTVPNITAFTNDQISHENRARVLGSASDAQLGTNPVSGTPFALQNLVVQQGQGIHEYRQGKIATFVAELYRDWWLKRLVSEMNSGKTFLEELSVEELQEVAEKVSIKQSNEWVREKILTTGKVPTEEERTIRMEAEKEGFMKQGPKKFLEIMKGELQDLPMDVFVNIKAKQKRMAEDADKLSNLVRQILANPEGFKNSGVGKLVNEILENSGFSPINFAEITKPVPVQVQPEETKQPQLTQ